MALSQGQVIVGFNLLLNNYAIRVADGITIMPVGVVSFAGKKATVCVAIYFDEPDFCESLIRCRIIGLLTGNGPEDKRQSFYTIRYWSTEFPNMSKGATKLTFRIRYTIAGYCHPTKERLVPPKGWVPNAHDSTQQAQSVSSYELQETQWAGRYVHG